MPIPTTDHIAGSIAADRMVLQQIYAVAFGGTLLKYDSPEDIDLATRDYIATLRDAGIPEDILEVVPMYIMLGHAARILNPCCDACGW